MHKSILKSWRCSIKDLLPKHLKLFLRMSTMLHVIENAVRMFHEQRDTFNGLAIRAMKGQYGWDQSAKQYIELYEKLLPAKKAAARAKAKAAKEAPAEPEPTKEELLLAEIRDILKDK